MRAALWIEIVVALMPDVVGSRAPRRRRATASIGVPVRLPSTMADAMPARARHGREDERADARRSPPRPRARGPYAGPSTRTAARRRRLSGAARRRHSASRASSPRRATRRPLVTSAARTRRRTASSRDACERGDEPLDVVAERTVFEERRDDAPHGVVMPRVCRRRDPPRVGEIDRLRRRDQLDRDHAARVLEAAGAPGVRPTVPMPTTSWLLAFGRHRAERRRMRQHRVLRHAWSWRSTAAP